jgi:hypothetical protein
MLKAQPSVGKTNEACVMHVGCLESAVHTRCDDNISKPDTNNRIKTWLQNQQLMWCANCPYFETCIRAGPPCEYQLLSTTGFTLECSAKVQSANQDLWEQPVLSGYSPGEEHANIHNAPEYSEAKGEE